MIQFVVQGGLTNLYRNIYKIREKGDFGMHWLVASYGWADLDGLLKYAHGVKCWPVDGVSLLKRKVIRQT